MDQIPRYTDRAEALDYLERVLDAAEASDGEVECVALRLFDTDGDFEDLVFGGNEKEQHAALMALRCQNGIR